MAERRELPVEQRDHPRLARVEHQIAEPEVAVHDRSSRRPPGRARAARRSAAPWRRSRGSWRPATGASSGRSGGRSSCRACRSRRARPPASRPGAGAPARRSSRRTCRRARWRVAPGIAPSWITRPSSARPSRRTGVPITERSAQTWSISRHRHVGRGERRHHPVLAVDRMRRGQQVARRLLAQDHGAVREAGADRSGSTGRRRSARRAAARRGPAPGPRDRSGAAAGRNRAQPWPSPLLLPAGCPLDRG